MRTYKQWLTHVDVHGVNVNNFISKESNDVGVTKSILPCFLITAVQLRRTYQVTCKCEYYNIEQNCTMKQPYITVTQLHSSNSTMALKECVFKRLICDLIDP